MKISDRLKPHFFTIAVATGLALAWVLSPLDWFDGFVLFLLGSVAGDWNRQLNPVVDGTEGPVFPWDEMNAGDKLAYFLPALAITVFGLIFLAMAIQFSRVAIDWTSIGVAIFVVVLGLGHGYWKWLHRYRSVDGS
ncbi:hypothetical protein [Qipengyuania gaetbuli]|uniref:hypothetical protein n=1 Tax=Qipengyuania gaetbuli TaxID=266952 RepID=UPI001CFC7956|nr:hypothetical protein [Qipengyuania gaetbuli]